MQQFSLKPALERLGLKQTELAALLDVAPRTVSQWATGTQPLPGPVAGYLRLLEAAGADVRSRELGRLLDRNKGLDEGMYRINYHGTADGIDEKDDALAVLRKGKIFGSDRHGGIFLGSYAFDPDDDINVVHLRIEMPPDGMLVNGVSAGARGTALDVYGTIERAAPVARTTILAGGRPIYLEVQYLGPLPN